MAYLDSAKEKIDKILINWFQDDPVMLNVWCLINRSVDPKQETIGIDVNRTRPTILYNPNWVNALSIEYLEMVMVSEGFKILLRHCTTRLKEPRQISSLASTITIEELLKNNQKTMWNNNESLKDFMPTAHKYDLPEKECFEEYYRQLYKNAKGVAQQIADTWNSMSQEDKEQLVDKQTEQSESNTDSEGFKEYGNDSHKALKDYFDPNGTSNNGWGENSLFDADISNFIDQRRDNVQGWGKFTGNCRGEIFAAQESSFSYKDIIKRFKKSVTNYKSYNSRMKVNRRYDLEFPGHRRELTTRILFAIDESGSMSDDDLSQGFAVINKICKHIVIDYLTFDTEVKMFEKDFKKAKSTFKVGGRGGTNPECVFKYAKQLKHRPDGLIIFTDGQFISDLKEPPYKVLWLLHSNNLSNPTNFGMVATLKRFENVHNW